MSVIKDIWLDDSGLDGGSADALDHGGERLPGEAVDQLRLAGIHVDHSRRDADGVEACLAQERIELSADHGVAAGRRCSST